MFDYNAIMIGRKEYQELSRKRTPDCSAGRKRASMLRRTRSGLGKVLIRAGERLLVQGKPGSDPIPIRP